MVASFGLNTTLIYITRQAQLEGIALREGLRLQVKWKIILHVALTPRLTLDTFPASVLWQTALALIGSI